jgi:hypothetical protein
MNPAKPNPAPTKAKGKALSNINRLIVRLLMALSSVPQACRQDARFCVD